MCNRVLDLNAEDELSKLMHLLLKRILQKVDEAENYEWVSEFISESWINSTNEIKKLNPTKWLRSSSSSGNAALPTRSCIYLILECTLRECFRLTAAYMASIPNRVSVSISDIKNATFADPNLRQIMFDPIDDIPTNMIDSDKSPDAKSAFIEQQQSLIADVQFLLSLKDLRNNNRRALANIQTISNDLIETLKHDDGEFFYVIEDLVYCGHFACFIDLSYSESDWRGCHDNDFITRYLIPSMAKSITQSSVLVLYKTI
ncbi:hypothetical protein ACOME3_007424 [Neoechinorhynchus agilis]